MTVTCPYCDATSRIVGSVDTDNPTPVGYRECLNGHTFHMDMIKANNDPLTQARNYGLDSVTRSIQDENPLSVEIPWWVRDGR